MTLQADTQIISGDLERATSFGADTKGIGVDKINSGKLGGEFL